MLVVHHLGVSQSERILWLLEELELPYKIVHHTRAPLLSPQSLKDVPGNATGKAPFFEDTDKKVQMSESGAICEYINDVYGGGKLSAKPGDKNYSDYLQFFHFANGTLQPAMVDSMFLGGSGAASDNMMVQMANDRLTTDLTTLDKQLAKSKWLAGDFTAADVMTLYATSTQRYWGPQVDLSKFTNIVRWMQDCGARPGYQKAMEKGDPDMKSLLEGPPPKIGMGAAGGVKSDHWKKSSG